MSYWREEYKSKSLLRHACNVIGHKWNKWRAEAPLPNVWMIRFCKRCNSYERFYDR